MALPRIGLHGSTAGIALPQPLSPSDAALTRRAFDMQDRGNVAAADRAIGELQDRLLLGDLLADRYLGRFHHATTPELTDWLFRYGSLPDAPALHALLLRRLPKGAAAPLAPEAVAIEAPRAAGPMLDDTDPENPVVPRFPMLDRAIAKRLQRGATQSALTLIAATKGLPPSSASLLRGEVARSMLIANDDAEALRVARLALGQTPAAQQTGLPAYVGGLAAWRLGLPGDARELFAEAADAPLVTTQVRAAAAFWTARADRRLHDISDAAHWLHRAAEGRTTLHGLIARRMLGLSTGIIPSYELLSQADVDVIAATDPGWRAFALWQVGQPERAEAELRLLWPMVRNAPPLRRSLMLVASGLGLTDLTAQLAEFAEAADGRPRDELRFPLPKLRPAGGFHVDPALVYALARLESNFDATAVSPAGARGLMQIMPITARYLAGNSSLISKSLHDPAVNLEVGQRYVTYLAHQDGIDDNLMHLLASYNAGLGSFTRWQATMRDAGDPLMFVETIPNQETRHFVEHALIYTWMYAARLHIPAPSLDDMAAGLAPRFTPLSEQGRISPATWRVH